MFTTYPIIIIIHNITTIFEYTSTQRVIATGINLYKLGLTVFEMLNFKSSFLVISV